MLKLSSIPHFQQRGKKKESCEAQEKEAERLGDDLAPWLFSFLFFLVWFGLVFAKLGWRPLLLKGFGFNQTFFGLRKKKRSKSKVGIYKCDQQEVEIF